MSGNKQTEAHSATFVAEHGMPRPLPIARRATFFIDGDPTGGQYEGWNREEYWNGWACPYFEKPVAEHVAKSFNGYFNVVRDEFIIPDMEDRRHRDHFQGLDIDTAIGMKHVYAIGAFGWIWNEKQRRQMIDDRINCGKCWKPTTAVTTTIGEYCDDCRAAYARTQSYKRRIKN